VLATRDEVIAAAAKCKAGSPAAAVLRAALAQRSGDTAEVDRLLTQLGLSLDPAARASLVDVHVPLLISTGQIDRAEQMLLDVAPQDSSQRAAIAALTAVIAAHRRDPVASAAAAERARELLVFTDDEFRRTTVLQRLSLAAFYCNNYLDSMDLALASVRVAEGAGFMRQAAGAYSVAYSIAHDVYGDPRLALYYAERISIVAKTAGDESIQRRGLASQAIVAAESGDRERLDSISATIMTGRLSRQFREEWILALALALPLAWDGHFEQFNSAIAAIRTGRNASERALCDALLALCAAVRNDVDEARRKTRSALHLTRRDPNAPAFDEQHRRVARCIAAAVCTRIGDHVRAKRALSSKDIAGSPQATLVAGSKRAPIVVGWGMVLDRANQSTDPQASNTLLTPAQIVLLRELSFGKTIPQISQEAGRSVATLRTHAQQINERLGVHGRAAAIAKGRELGLI